MGNVYLQAKKSSGRCIIHSELRQVVSDFLLIQQTHLTCFNNNGYVKSVIWSSYGLILCCAVRIKDYI